MNSHIESLNITSIWDKVAHLYNSYPIQVSHSNGSYYLFVSYWGDLYKLSESGEILWDLSFNKKEIISKHPLKANLQGTTFGFKIFNNRIFFIDSKKSLHCYSEEGKLIKEYASLTLAGNPLNFNIIDENNVFFVTYELVGSDKIFRFIKYNLTSGKNTEVFKITKPFSSENYFIKLIHDKIVILGSFGETAEVFSMSGEKLPDIAIPRNTKRRYDIKVIPKEVDYFSLTIPQKLDYANDMTIDFSLIKNSPLIIHKIYDRLNLSSIKSERLFTYVDNNNETQEFKLRSDNIFQFDDFGNFIYTKHVGEETFIYKIPSEGFSTLVENNTLNHIFQ